ncbi:hypothetical protein DBV14_07810 [Variovorax sp. KBW07]|uniref:filamentous haemagglutinin family protein n=1 Tax=Variovorax sp. KBW07 TaxID=2153358 RepID=UPI000F57F5E4|nr:filamentous haemagglutinin family protein [Variovorax sp. KBW07]RQO59211.1 hypothetical protein DBV14_07810 [Variovorax sp. KBW07]
MNTGMRGNGDRRQGNFRLAPVARAMALMLVASGMAGHAQAQRAFSGAWFNAKGTAQSTAALTGYLPNGQPASSLTNPVARQKADNPQWQRSINNLNLAAQTIAAQQAAQAAARQAAQNDGSVPDGLADGGLKVDSNSLSAGWANANAPVQSAAGGKTEVKIEQTAEKAILNWETFNVGRNTVVQFDQRAGARPDGTNPWIALNRINDPSGKPSQIAGQIKADGAVYLVNRNGIVFTGSSQVNTRTLVASSLALSDKQFKLGINNRQITLNPGNDFGIPQFGEFNATKPEVYGDAGFKAGVGGAPDKMGGLDRFDPGAPPGEVRVDAGARLAVDPGGKLMLFAPKVRNAGHLSAPDGQVIMAAGENVYLKTPRGNDPNGVRGLDVAVSAVPGWGFSFNQVLGAHGLMPAYADASYVASVRDVVLPEMAARAAQVGYEVANTGIVQSDRGNITLQARDVRQGGVLTATTALNNRSGSIVLRAWGQGVDARTGDLEEILNWSAGTLTLAPNSVTQVLPDASDRSQIEAAALATRYMPGRVEMYGKLIDVQPRAGVIVPSGTINVESAVNPIFTQLPYYKGSLRDESRIYLDSEAFLSVAGVQDILLPMSRNFIEADLRINELRDSPLLANSWVRGKKVIVDRRANGVFAGGPMGGVEWVLGSDGKTYIPGAWVGTPLGDMTGWIGVGKTDLQELSAEAGKITLRAGGAVITRAGSLLDVAGGSVRYADGRNTSTKLMGADGRVYGMQQAMPDMDYVGIAGQYLQNHARWGVKTTWRNPLIGADMPEAGYTEGRKAGAIQIFAGGAMVLEGDYWGGSLVGERQQMQPTKNLGGELQLGNGIKDDRPWWAGQLVVSRDPHRLAAGFNAQSALGDDFRVPPVPDSGVKEPGKLTYLSDEVLNRSGMGRLLFNVSGDFILEPGAVLNLAPGSTFMASGGEAATINLKVDGTIRAPGGKIALDSFNGTLAIGAASALDVRGQWINAWRDGTAPAQWAMDGGTLALSAAKFAIDPGVVLDVSGGGRVDAGKQGLPKLRVGNGGTVSLGGVTPQADLAALDIRGYAAGSAARFELATLSPVQIGGTAPDAKTVVLPEALYSERGFGAVAVNVGDKAGIAIAEGASVMRPAASIDLATFPYRDVATGATLAQVAPVGVLRPQERLARKPASLELGTVDGPIDVGAGAVVRADTGGKLAMSAGGATGKMSIKGTLEAPAGRIELSAADLTLEAGSQLLARGVPVIQADSRGTLTGQVLAGGDVSLVGSSALQLQAGARIDVSGASGEVQVPVAGARLGSVGWENVALSSDGGTILLKGGSRGTMRVAADLQGRSGGAGASGGSLSIVDSSEGPPATPGGVTVPTTLYWRDPVTSKVMSKIYSQVPDLDLYDEYGTAPLKFTLQMRSAIAGLPGVVGGGMEIVNDLDAPGLSAVVRPWEANTAISPVVLDLLARHFYTSAALTTHVVVPDVKVQSTSRIQAASISQGGFDAVTLNAAKGISLADGVHVKAGRSLSLATSKLGNGGGRGSAQLSAAHISLDALPLFASTGWANPAALGGQLTLSGSLIDLRRAVPEGTGGMRITGFGRTVLQADDVRLGGALPATMTAATSLQVNLDVDGQLVMKAGQVYPSTAMTAVVRAGESIAIERLGDAGPPALSAGGTLRLEAPVIAQNGVLRAPLGQIELNAGKSLALGSDSITSVTGSGMAIPYGTLSNNEHWLDPTRRRDDGSPSDSALVAPPEKRITMKAPDVALAKGAVVDISGGGDLYAWEFVPGPGGSHDVLSMPGTYAILPGRSGTAPASAIEAGQRIWLSGGPGLAAGWYDLLPARYALLPGAMTVQSTGTAWTGPAKAGFKAPDGGIVMQGKTGNAYGGTQQATASVWRVMSGDTLRRYSEYNEAFANDFFASEAFKLTQYRLTGQRVVTPRLARDGGAVVFDATRSLVLDGTLRSQPDRGGRGGLVDIAGKKIAIVGAGQDAGTLRGDGYLVIDAAALSSFGAGSLLVGGTRKGDPLGVGLNVTASDIVVRNDAGSALYGPEIILAASGQVAIDAGSVVSAHGTGASTVGDLIVAPQQREVYDTKGTATTDDDVLVTPARDWGALVRVANGSVAKVLRQNVDTTTGGMVRIGAGADVNGGAALLLDATRNTELAASARIAGTDLSVASGRIGFGGGTEGMVLDEGALAQLANSQRLTLRSYSSFDFYKSLDLGAAGMASLTLDGARLSGTGNGDVVLRGDTITLMNSGAAATGVDGTGTGGLTLDAGTLVLGAGRKTLSGFGTIAMHGRDRTIGEGNGGIDAGGSALTLTTPLLTGRGGAAQSIVTRGALQVLGAGGNGASDPGLQDSLGTRLSLGGGSVLFGSRAVALGGSVDMTASAGSVVLASGAQVDVGGFAKNFFDMAAYADAGRINLSAVGGDVRLDAGSVLHLAAHADGGNAGTLALAASNGGTVVLDGRIAAQAGNGGKAGAFSLDIAALGDFAGFNRRLNDAGFYRSRQFRIRQGDVTLDGTTTVEDFGLAADRGSVNITGRVDARAAYGGAIRVTGGNGVSMQDGAQLLAGATGALGSGRVMLEAAGGSLDLRGGTIDVAGADGGKVRLRARQNASHDDLAAVAVKAGIVGARSAVLEGMAVYENQTSVDAIKATAIADATTFAGNGGAIAGRLGLAPGLRVMPGIEISSTGDLAMNSDWNLFTDFANAREGSLTLRAAGNLLIDGHLSDGFNMAGRTGTLQESASWNLRLVAGGDMDSANALALKPLAGQAAGSGTVRIGTADTDPDAAVDNGAGKLVRTGTGDLEVRAGRDLKLAHKDSAIYTAGRKDTTTWSDFSSAPANAAYGVAGGNLDIAAQGGIEAQPSGQRFTEWLNRQGNVNGDRVFGPYQDTTSTCDSGVCVPNFRPTEQASWWVNHGEFRQGVAALGGGNVNVSAGGDLGNLVVALTSNMRMRGGRSVGEAMNMEVRNGGAMTVEAGGAIRGGQYYIGRGTGDIRAGETTTGHSVTATMTGDTTSTSKTFMVAPVLALGDATLSLRTAGDLRLQSVVDPLLVRYGNGTTPDGRVVDHGAYMTGYTGRSGLSLVSTGGDITLVNQADFIFRDVVLRNSVTAEDNLVGNGGNRYPARLHATAMNGGLQIQGALYVMPAATNDVQLMAQRDVRFNSQDAALLKTWARHDNDAEIIMARGTPLMVPSPFLPAGASGYSHQIRMDPVLRNAMSPNVYLGGEYFTDMSNPDVLTLADDHAPSRIYAARGSILGANIATNEQTWLRAGTDIRGIQMSARNVHADDTTLLEAGNDILAVTRVRSGLNGTIHGSGSILVEGPGSLVLSAGRDVYANDLRITTLGNQQYNATDNRPIPKTQVKGLPEQGATITVMAGMNGAPAYDAFAGAYLDPSKVSAMPDHLKTRGPDGNTLPLYLVDGTEMRAGREKVTRRGLVSYMKDMTGETLAPLAAWQRFQALPQLAQQQFLRQILLLELRDAGRDQNEPGAGGLPRNGGYNRGYAAIETLFPGEQWKGNVAANQMMLRTMAGGDIDVLSPGGGLQVAALGTTVPDGHGLVTLGSGHINVFVRDDVTVNRSRILSFVPEATSRGSDQIIWSSKGDIDAGRGSKTVRVPSAPEVVTDLDGNTIVREKSDMSGSGIGTVGDGDVDLVAPRGTVNAGDAGVRVAGNLNIAALQVLNADNIQVKGESKGIPVVAAVNVGALANASAAASQAAMAAQDAVQRDRAASRQSLPSVFTVRVLGFGNDAAERGGALSPPAGPDARPPGVASHDPNHRVQVIGHGQNLKPEQLARLTEGERRRLQQPD